MWQPFEYAPKNKIIFGKNSLARLGEITEQFTVKRVAIVTDQGIIDTGHVEKAAYYLTQKNITTYTFSDFAQNPTTENVTAGVDFAKEHQIELIIGLGGGSSMDCAKGVNFLLTNGGEMQDYWGYGKAKQKMLPMIGIPTTTGTGSEAQSYALISDSKTHRKMACGDPKASFRVAILDPSLTVTQPTSVMKATGIDAISHAIESAVTKRRNALSASFSLYAWKLLNANFESMLFSPENEEANMGMQMGACYSGMAIENSMLGATHACANPLTKNYGITHGHAIALMLPHVIRYNADHAQDIYEDLCRISGIVIASCAGKALARRIEKIVAATELPTTLSAYGITADAINNLAVEANEEWTAQFNPRIVKYNDFVSLYNKAL
ncbi:iron-containing alcohol dehydrogenase [Candidatus Uabimicrobium helgolandensis]